MPKLTNSVPKYRHHKQSGQAVVTLRGRDVYLGPYNSKGSKLEYDRVISEWLAAGRPTTPVQESCEVTVTELILAYWKFAQSHYVKDGQPTGAIPGIKVALRLLRQNVVVHCMRMVERRQTAGFSLRPSNYFLIDRLKE